MYDYICFSIVLVYLKNWLSHAKMCLKNQLLEKEYTI